MPRPPQPIIDGQRKCTRCRLWKPLEEFTPRNDRPGKRLSGCKACYAAHAKRRRIKNPGENLAQVKAWQKRHPDKAKANRHKRWQRHKDKEMAYMRDWFRMNPAARRLHDSRRRARMRGAKVGTFSRSDWEAIKARQDYACLMCQRREPEITLTIDHIIPLSRNGTHEKANIQGLCPSCNSSKGTRTLDLRATGCG